MFSNVSQQNQLHLVSNLHRLIIWPEVHMSYVHPVLFHFPGVLPASCWKCPPSTNTDSDTTARESCRSHHRRQPQSLYVCSSLSWEWASSHESEDVTPLFLWFHPKVTFSQWGLPWHPLTKYAFLPIWLVHLFLALLFIRGLHCLFILCMCSLSC